MAKKSPWNHQKWGYPLRINHIAGKTRIFSHWFPWLAQLGTTELTYQGARTHFPQWVSHESSTFSPVVFIHWMGFVGKILTGNPWDFPIIFMEVSDVNFPSNQSSDSWFFSRLSLVFMCIFRPRNAMAPRPWVGDPRGWVDVDPNSPLGSVASRAQVPRIVNLSSQELGRSHE